MSSRSDYPAEGESLGPYRVVRRIGGGGMGVVFEAEDTALDRRVALKVIAAHLAEDDEFRARFIREAHALASLDSPHVVHVYTHGQDHGRLYLVTQLVPDGDLGEMLRTFGAPPVRVALDLIGQVASGLADAHAAGLVHRDIKPSNVLLRRRDTTMQAFLSDFGIARFLDAEQTGTAGTIGTPSYMAPELHTGGRAGVASDIYSLGCVLWATLTGSAPYSGTSEYQIVRAHHEQPIPQLSGDDPMVLEVNRILRTAMAKDPRDRYEAAWQLRDVLRRARSMPETERNALADPIPHVGPPAPHRRRLAGVSALIAAALIAAVGIGVALGDQEPGGTFTGRSDDDATLTLSPSPSTVFRPPSVKPGDREVAERSLAAVLEAQGTMTSEQAECTADRWIEMAGLQEMANAGFFDPDWNYVDLPREEMTPDIAMAATTAALECATGESG